MSRKYLESILILYYVQYLMHFNASIRIYSDYKFSLTFCINSLSWLHQATYNLVVLVCVIQKNSYCCRMSVLILLCDPFLNAVWHNINCVVLSAQIGPGADQTGPSGHEGVRGSLRPRPGGAHVLAVL